MPNEFGDEAIGGVAQVNEFGDSINAASTPGSRAIDPAKQWEKDNPKKAMLSRFIRPALQMGGMVGGGILATPSDIVSGPIGTVIGGGVGYAAGGKGADALDMAMGKPTYTPKTVTEAALSTAGDVVEGVAMEMGGQALGKGLEMAAKPVVSMIKSSASKNVGQAFQATKDKNKDIMEKITPEILKRPMGETFAFTGPGLEQKSEAARNIARNAINNFGKLEGQADVTPIINKLESLKTKKHFIVEGKTIDPVAVQHIDEVKGLLEQYGDSLSKEGLRNIERGFDAATYGVKGAVPTYTEESLLKFKKVAADEIRDILAKDNPELAQLNKQFNFWANFNKVIGDTNKRTKPHKGFMPFLAGMAGAGGGYAGHGIEGAIGTAAVMAGLVKASQSPGWKLVSARTKNNIAEAVANNNAKAFKHAVVSAAITATPLVKGDPILANIDGKQFAVHYDGKAGEKLRVRTLDNKLKVVPLDEIEFIADQPEPPTP